MQIIYSVYYQLNFALSQIAYRSNRQFPSMGICFLSFAIYARSAVGRIILLQYLKLIAD